jgi:hypothetical protein
MAHLFNNELTVRGKPQDIAAFKLKAGKDVPHEEPSPLHFHNFVPAPNDLLNQVGPEMTKSRIDWEDENWGCNWGAIECKLSPGKDDSEAIYYFETGWRPPTIFLYKVAQMHPELLFILDTDCFKAGSQYYVTFWRDYYKIDDCTWITSAQCHCICGATNGNRK